MTCADCNAGQGSDQGSTGCEDCAPGKYSPVDGRPCGYCADGSYQPGAGKTSCIVCPPGLLSDPAFQFCTSCKPGEFVRNKTACVLCTPGHYAPSAQTGKCLSCTAGFHTTVPEGAERCIACSPGSFSEKNSVNCSVCSIGTWGGSGFRSCTNFDEGKVSLDPPPPNFAPLNDRVDAIQVDLRDAQKQNFRLNHFKAAATSGSSSCRACQPGKLASNRGQASCDPCQAGKYSSEG